MRSLPSHVRNDSDATAILLIPWIVQTPGFRKPRSDHTYLPATGAPFFRTGAGESWSRRY